MDVLEVLLTKKGRERMSFAEKLDEARRLAEERRRKAGDVTAAVERALAALHERDDEEAVQMAKVDARLDSLEMGKGAVSKAGAAARELRQVVEKYLDRHPTDARGRDTTPEQALAAVSGTREGRRLIEAVRADGSVGAVAFDKAFHGERVEVATPGPTRAEQRLDEMARAVAKERGVSREMALVEVVDSPAGRELVKQHRKELTR